MPFSIGYVLASILMSKIPPNAAKDHLAMVMKLSHSIFSGKSINAPDKTTWEMMMNRTGNTALSLLFNTAEIMIPKASAAKKLRK